jgi:hypothetical protein
MSLKPPSPFVKQPATCLRMALGAFGSVAATGLSMALLAAAPVQSGGAPPRRAGTGSRTGAFAFTGTRAFTGASAGPGAGQPPIQPLQGRDHQSQLEYQRHADGGDRYSDSRRGQR